MSFNRSYERCLTGGLQAAAVQRPNDDKPLRTHAICSEIKLLDGLDGRLDGKRRGPRCILCILQVFSRFTLRLSHLGCTAMCEVKVGRYSASSAYSAWPFLTATS